jgi:hypothetical protein
MESNERRQLLSNGFDGLTDPKRLKSSKAPLLAHMLCTVYSACDEASWAPCRDTYVSCTTIML